MKIKRIEFMEEITDLYNDNIDVLVENEDAYKYIIVVGTPQDLLEEMNQENFIVAPKDSREFQIGYFIGSCLGTYIIIR